MLKKNSCSDLIEIKLKDNNIISTYSESECGKFKYRHSKFPPTSIVSVEYLGGGACGNR